MGSKKLSIEIAGVNYDIHRLPKGDKRLKGGQGIILYTEGKIYVDTTLCQSYIKKVVLHEIIHAALHTLQLPAILDSDIEDYDLEEIIVHHLADHLSAKLPEIMNIIKEI